MGNRRHSEDEFKEQAVRLALESDNNSPEIARDLGISPGNLRRWIRDHLELGATSTSLSRDDAAELARLRRENKKLRAERDILKKATALFAGESNGSSALSRNTGAFGRWLGCAGCSVSPAVDFMSGWIDLRVGDLKLPGRFMKE